MKKLSAIVAGVCLSIAFAGPLQAKEQFKARMNGAQEVPPVVTDTSGRAFFRVNNKETAITFEMRVRKGVDITQAHIHCAPSGANGPVVITLAGLVAAGLDLNGKWISKATFDEANIQDTTCGSTIPELAQAMRDGDAYVNVHSLANASGEIRGQIK